MGTQDQDRPEPGRCLALELGLRRVLAPNPSPMTLWGTQTHLIGEGDVAVLDPGPALPGHLAAILAALRPGERIRHILVSHAHLDHSPLARPLAEATGAEVLAFGPATAGRSPQMQRLAEAGMAGGEGVDHGFAPDRCLEDGERLEGDGWVLEAIHTPGHMGNHLCFAWGDRLFSGDHVMGWSSSLVSPPDGDMGAYLRALERLAARDWRVLHPAHGAPVPAPAARLAFLAEHRRQRETAILAALDEAPQRTLPALTARVYHDTPAALKPAAARNLLAHLIDLAERNLVIATPSLSADARFSRA
ncbi:MBL fold metallo-hydrolase [Paracoccaceae bacterium Fryx2]|nr:MBL fold metallo-hydrolase [Paracoccaceae bacterium Fryx2]